jgi:hypothetical protein
MEALIRDALKDFDTFKELTETIPLEVLSAEAEALSKSQQQIFQEYKRRLAAHQLADRVRQCSTWAEVEEVAASAPDRKQEIWALLTDEEKQQIKILKIAAHPIDPNSEPLVGKQVFVPSGAYRQSGEGIVVCDRGFGTLRMVEVRMQNRQIQIASVSELRAVSDSSALLQAADRSLGSKTVISNLG